MKKSLLILMVLAFNLSLSLHALAQSDSLRMDSLKRVLPMQKDDSNKVNTLNALSEMFVHGQQFNETTSLNYAKQALAIAEKNKFKHGVGTAYFNLAVVYNIKRTFPEANKFYLEAIEVLGEIGDKSAAARCYMEMAGMGWITNNMAAALKNTYTALKLYEEANDKRGIAIARLWIGDYYSVYKNFPEAMSNYSVALKHSLEIANDTLLSECYGSLTSINLQENKFDEALKNDSAALLINEKLNDKKQVADNLSSLGDVFYGKGTSEVDETRGRENFLVAQQYYLRSLKLYDSIAVTQSKSFLYSSLGRVNVRLKDFKMARYYLGKSLQREDQTFSNDWSMEKLVASYGGFAELDSAEGNYKEAYNYYKLYSLYRDSLQTGQNANKAESSKLQYDFEKQQAVAKAEQEKKDSEARRIKNQQLFVILALGIIVLAVIIIAVIQFRNSRQKQKANTVLRTTLDELKSTQAQLIQSEKMASLGELTAGIAHEIQNPLNFVNNFSEVNKEMITELKEEIDKGNYNEAKLIANDIEENSGKINHHGKRADGIVKGMLQHSRTSSGQKEPTDINALADEYLRLAYHGMRAKDKNFNATLQTEFDPSIGKINIVPQDIGRVLLNLFNNAFYAVNEKAKQNITGYELAVSMSTKRSLSFGEGRGEVQITVKDNGNGIPDTIKEKIFQPFFTTKPTGQGTGLGLSLAYDIVKAHGGEIKVETREGEGSKFIIQLPVKV